MTIKKSDFAFWIVLSFFVGVIAMLSINDIVGIPDDAYSMNRLRSDGIVSDTTAYPDGILVIRQQTYHDTTFVVTEGGTP